MYKSRTMEAGRAIPVFIAIVIVALAAIGAALAYLMGSHQPDSSKQTVSQTDPIVIAQATEEIILDQDMTLSLGDTTLYVSKGATRLTGYLSMTSREPDLYYSAGEPGWTRPIVINIAYLNYGGTPASSVTFYNPVLICFQVSEEQWQDFNKRLDAYQVEYYTESLVTSRWVVLPRITNPEGRQICGATDHLSLFALAIKPEEEILPSATPVMSATPIPTDTPTAGYPLRPTPTKRRVKESTKPPPPPPPPPPPATQAP